MKEEFGAIFEPDWPWTPHNHELSDMSILITPDLSGIACVLEWRVSPLPFGASLGVADSLLGTRFEKSRGWLDYPEDPFEMWRLLFYSVRRRLGGTGTVPDTGARRNLLDAMTFGFAFDYVPQMASDPKPFPKSYLSRVANTFGELKWDEVMWLM